MSASSIGPIGMPNSSIAASIVSGFMPSSTRRIAFCMYGAEHAVHEEARRVLHRQRQLVDLAHERRGLRAQLRVASAPLTRLRPASSAAPD